MATRQQTRTKHTTNSTARDDRCDLCGDRVGLTFRARWGHLRSDHTSYANGLLLRLVAPLLFAAVVITLALVHAPVFVSIGVLVVCMGVVAVGMLQASRAKRGAAIPENLRFSALVKNGGFRFLVFGGLVAALLIMSHR